MEWGCEMSIPVSTLFPTRPRKRGRSKSNPHYHRARPVFTLPKFSVLNRWGEPSG